jgi:hypothetical protein
MRALCACRRRARAYVNVLQPATPEARKRKHSDQRFAAPARCMPASGGASLAVTFWEVCSAARQAGCADIALQQELPRNTYFMLSHIRCAETTAPWPMPCGCHLAARRIQPTSRGSRPPAISRAFLRSPTTKRSQLRATGPDRRRAYAICGRGATPGHPLPRGAPASRPRPPARQAEPPWAARPQGKLRDPGMMVASRPHVLHLRRRRAGRSSGQACCERRAGLRRLQHAGASATGPWKRSASCGALAASRPPATPATACRCVPCHRGRGPLRRVSDA